MFNIALLRHEYLVVICTGGPVLNDYLATVGLIADVVQREGTRSVLVDLSSIDYGLSDQERLEIVRCAAGRLQDVRVAIVAYTPWRLQKPETAARQIGLQVQVFGDLSEAGSWLIHDRSAPG